MVGGVGNFFAGAIIDKLLKEKCSLYHISGKSTSNVSQTHKGVATYNIALDDEYAQVVMKTVAPDAILFFGAFDDRYSWKDYHRSSAKYTSELTNIIVAAADMNVKKFIYLSTLNVYGFDNSGEIDEDTPVAPGNVKSIVIAQGERLCNDFNERGRIDAITLRFGTVYGDYSLANVQSDYILDKCFKMLAAGKAVVNNIVTPVITSTDASIAVYKALYLDGESGIYNVCDGDTINDSTITDIIMVEYADMGIELQIDDRFKKQDYKIVGKKFREQFLFFQKTGYAEGIRTVAKFAKSKRHLYSKKKVRDDSGGGRKDALKYLYNKVLPYAENLFLFAVFAFLSSFFQESQYLGNIDFILIYVIVVSVTFGKKHVFFYIVLSMVHYGYQNISANHNLLDLLSYYPFIVRLMVLFVVGMLIGHTRDKLHEKIVEVEERAEYAENEFKKLNEIHDVTVSIKEAFEDRIISNDNSLATNYSIIEKLSSLVPHKTYINSLSIIRSIVKASNICIYTKADDEGAFKLEYWTNEESVKLGETININDFSELCKAFEQGEIFVNKSMSPELPLLMSAIKARGTIEALVMVWNVEFEALTMHHINLFSTLTKIITKSVENAVYYRLSLEKQFTLQYRNSRSEYLLDEGDFSEAVDASEEGKDKYNIPYRLLDVRLAGMTVPEAFETVKPLVKGSYYLHKEERTLQVLLLNTGDGNKL